MAFCTHCGAELSEGVAFCSHCGTAVDNQGNGKSVIKAAPDNTVYTAPNRDKEYKELQQIYHWFLEKRNLYIQIPEETATLNARIIEEQKKIKDIPKLTKGRKVAGIILLIVGAFFCIVAIANGFSTENIDYGIFYMIVMLTAGVILLLAHRSKTKQFKIDHPNYEKEQNAVEAQRRAVAENLKKELSDKEKELEQWYDEYRKKYGACRIAFKETDPRLLRVFLSYFESGRADTIKEAVSYFDQERHNRYMEQQAAETNAAAQASARSSAQTASAANTAAAYEAASFWLK